MVRKILKDKAVLKIHRAPNHLVAVLNRSEEESARTPPLTKVPKETMVNWSTVAESISKRGENPGNQIKMSCIHFSSRYPAPEKPRQKRAVIQDMVRPLKQWLLRHRHNPYPTKAEKVQLALGSNMTLVQVTDL